MHVADQDKLGDLILDALAFCRAAWPCRPGSTPRPCVRTARCCPATARSAGSSRQAGRGVRVDTAGYPGYTVSPRYDSLLAKVITTGGTLEEAARRAVRAVAEFDIAGVPTNTGLLQGLLQALSKGPGLGAGFEPFAGWVDAHAADLSGGDAEEPPDKNKSCPAAAPRCARR